MAPRKPRKRCGTCPQRRSYTGDGSECPVCAKWAGVWRARYLSDGCPDTGPTQSHAGVQHPFRPCAKCHERSWCDPITKECVLCARGEVRPTAPKGTAFRPRKGKSVWSSHWDGPGKEDGGADE